MERHEDQVSRRRLIAGMGVASAGAMLAAAGASPAAAASLTPPPGETSTRGRTTPGGIPTPIASAPVDSVTYRFLTMWDFYPEEGTRRWGGSGAQPVEAATAMWAMMPLPAGATLYDVEWYLSNSVSVDVLARLWVAGQGQILTGVGAEGTIAAGTGAIVAHRFPVPASSDGPYPHGTALSLAVFLPADGTGQINGARVGYRSGPGELQLLASPARAYDSRSSDGPLAPGAVRDISLAALLPVGATAALVNVSVTSTVGSGTLRVGRAGLTPAATSIQWSRTGDQVTNAVTSVVANNRKIRVLSYASSGATHLVVDVVGYYA